MYLFVFLIGLLGYELRLGQLLFENRHSVVLHVRPVLEGFSYPMGESAVKSVGGGVRKCNGGPRKRGRGIGCPERFSHS